MTEPLIPKHGGYRKLRSIQVAQLVYDVTARFCGRYIDKRSRTHDQMVQAARSGVQNIAEGSLSKKGGHGGTAPTDIFEELKLTNVARASLEELRLDYEDFLRQRGLVLWGRDEPLRQELVDRRAATAEEVVLWVRAVHEQDLGVGRSGQVGRSGPPTQTRQEQSTLSTSSTLSTQSAPPYPELAANAALVLINVVGALIDRQVAALAAAFEKEGGFTERLYRTRKARQ